MSSYLRFRVSTAFMCFGLLLLPWSISSLPYADLFPSCSWAYSAFRFVVRDLSSWMLVFAFFFALAAVVWFMVRRRWPAAGQAAAEMVVCALAVAYLVIHLE